MPPRIFTHATSWLWHRPPLFPQLVPTLLQQVPWLGHVPPSTRFVPVSQMCPLPKQTPGHGLPASAGVESSGAQHLLFEASQVASYPTNRRDGPQSTFVAVQVPPWASHGDWMLQDDDISSAHR
jgi:hypothetical protein